MIEITKGMAEGYRLSSVKIEESVEVSWASLTYTLHLVHPKASMPVHVVLFLSNRDGSLTPTTKVLGNYRLSDQARKYLRLKSHRLARAIHREIFK